MSLWENRKFVPMLLGEVDEPFDSDDYIYELKFDGIRALVFASPEDVKIYSRRKIDITHLYPELGSIKELVNKKTIFDGEIVAMENGVPSFSKLQKRVHLKDKRRIKKLASSDPVVFMCFDVLYVGSSLIDEPIEVRKKKLERFDENDVFIKTQYIEKNGIDFFKKIKKMNLEGIVAKKKGSTYKIDERSNDWVKIKNFQNEDFIIGGFIEREENYVISLLIGEVKEENLFYVGKVSLGKKTALYKKVKNLKKKKKSPFCDFEENNINYVEPSLKCKVSYMEKTENGHLRQPFISQDDK